jgi:hypothetical protein
MKVRKLDDITHDWNFGKGLSDYASDLIALEQNVETRLLSWKNDCFFAMQDGVDYKYLLDKGQGNNLAQAVKLQILATEGVTKVSDLIAELNSDRSMEISCKIDTIYGNNYQIAISA